MIRIAQFGPRLGIGVGFWPALGRTSRLTAAVLLSIEPLGLQNIFSWGLENIHSDFHPRSRQSTYTGVREDFVNRIGALESVTAFGILSFSVV